MVAYKRNHYVPEWYQKRFFSDHQQERKFYYLDLKPETVIEDNGTKYTKKTIRRWSPPSCFCQNDLYTTQFGAWQSTDIEQFFFGRIDSKAREALDYFASFEHPSADHEAFSTLIGYLSIQKLRTPKGLQQLSRLLSIKNRNTVLLEMQRLKDVHCALWTECIWAILDASGSHVKFLISDHPVTLYNQRCFPGSKWCKGASDPDIAFNGTHTLFPLCHDKLLLLTNLSWVRNPYQNPLSRRPNPNPFRTAFFNFTQIQTGRSLSEADVVTINYLIKKRAYRYVASPIREWLYPELTCPYKRWDDIGRSYFLMPDPRSVEFSSATYIGHTDGSVEAFDEYGRSPDPDDPPQQAIRDMEWCAFHAFQGEYARLFGPQRRGRTFMVHRIEPSVDSDDYHAYHLKLESQFPKPRYKRKSKRRRP